MPSDQNSSSAPLVSIICRSIGRSELKQALSSAESQTYPNIEIVLVQASQKSLSDFSDLIEKVPVNLIYSGKNLSRSDAANAGLEAAQGEYIMFLDDDDWIAGDHVQNLVAYLNDNTDIQAAYSSTQKTSFDGAVLKEVFSQDFSRQLLMHDNYIPIHSMLFSRRLLDKNCRFDNNFDIFEDWDFWLQLSQHTDFAHVENLTAFYREGGESETASTSAEANERFSGEGVIAVGRAKLFSKWLKIWDGSAYNQLVGSLDKSGVIHKLNQTIALQHQKIEEQESSVTALNTELGDAYTLLHEANLRNESLMSDFQLVQQELADISNTANAQALHIKQLEDSIDTIFKSTSWRLMGPFRRIVRILRSLVGSKQRTVIYASNLTDDTKPVNGSSVDRVKAQINPIHYAIDIAAYTSGCLYIHGWACGSPAVESIELIHGATKTPIAVGGIRNDIAKKFPLIRSARHSGFSFFGQIDQADTYTLRVSDADGVRDEIPFSPTTLLSLSELSSSGELYVLDPIDQYTLYRLLNKESDTPQEMKTGFNYEPLISIIVPVYNVSKQWLDACIESVINQSYSKWELCLHDDASSMQETLDCLKAWEEKDSRINVQYGTENKHISGASNSALEIAKGEFIGLMDNDDELAPNALFWIVDAINSNPNADYLYTDEDKIDEQGNYCQPHFKPDWSPEMIESMMYVGHFGVIRRSIIDKVGGFRHGYEGSQDFDLTLRISQVSHNFVHIPKVLYHWRIIPGSVAGGSDQKSYAYTSGFKALQDHVNTGASRASVSTTATPGLYRVDRVLNNPRVAIIMPFHNKADMTIDCLQSILKSSYTNYQVVLISNNSNEVEYDAVARFVATLNVAKIAKHDIPFNWSAINNWGANQVDADYYLFLNNDMKVINEDWIQALLSCACDSKVGAVGAKLLYEDDTVQHAGIIMNLGGVAGHPFKGLPADHPGYFGYAEITRNVAAVTGACLLVSKSVLEKAEGFDESLGVAYNDVDFCLRLIELGFRIVYTPFARLYHFESKTRPKTPADMTDAQRQQFQQESDYIMRRHAKYFEDGDPYYNKALTLKFEDYSLRL